MCVRVCIPRDVREVCPALHLWYDGVTAAEGMLMLGSRPFDESSVLELPMPGVEEAAEPATGTLHFCTSFVMRGVDITLRAAFSWSC